PSHRARSDSPRPWCSRGHERQMHSHDDKERHMKMLSTTVLMGALAGAVLLLTSSTAGAQSKTLEGESETVKVTIEAIDQGSRTMTVKDGKGVYETLDVPPEVKRFSELKV